MKKKSKSAGHGNSVAQFPVASKRSANLQVKSTSRLRSASIQKAGQQFDDTHPLVASSGATVMVKPTSKLPRTKREAIRLAITIEGSRRPAIMRFKSTPEVQDAPISNGRPHPETHVKGAIAADDQTPDENQIQFVIGTNSKRGHDAHETQSGASSLGDDHGSRASQSAPVISTKSKRDRLLREAHDLSASLGNDPAASETQKNDVIPTIRELWKNRQAWHRAEKSLTLQGKAQCRRFTEGDKTEANKLFASLEKMAEGHAGVETQKAVAPAILPFIEARKPLEAHRKLIEKELIRLAKSLPIYPWAENVQGFGAMSLAAIVGEAGDLSNYATPSRLWKRMGLAVINGKRQRRVSDAIEALEHGYSPSRRSVMFNIGGCLIGGMGRGPRPFCNEDIQSRSDLSPYQKRFIDLIRREVERVTDTWNGPEHKREPVEKNGKLYESYSSHAANRIRRRIEKEFLCDLLVAWKACSTTLHVKPNFALSDKQTLLEAAE